MQGRRGLHRDPYLRLLRTWARVWAREGCAGDVPRLLRRFTSGELSAAGVREPSVDGGRAAGRVQYRSRRNSLRGRRGRSASLLHHGEGRLFAQRHAVRCGKHVRERVRRTVQVSERIHELRASKRVVRRAAKHHPRLQVSICARRGERHLLSMLARYPHLDVSELARSSEMRRGRRRSDETGGVRSR